MILAWEQLALHYGPELNTYRPRFETAGMTTFGLLCCRFTPSDDRLAASSGDHAEAKLLLSKDWTEELPAAFDRWSPGDSPIVVTLAINRSPCRDCSNKLVAALNTLTRRFPMRVPSNRFVLASKGAYEDAPMKAATGQNDLIRLRDSGWELCVLQVGPKPSARGEILREGIERVSGKGFVRLR